MKNRFELDCFIERRNRPYRVQKSFATEKGRKSFIEKHNVLEIISYELPEVKVIY